MPSFQRLLVLAILGVTLCANAAVVPTAEGADVRFPSSCQPFVRLHVVQLAVANENDVTPDVSPSSLIRRPTLTFDSSS
jgi:hypothetical protein